jgi:two-component system sensor histidine kinase CiaH
MTLKKKRLIIITVVYWVLLTYIIAALVWWFIALENQNKQMTNYKLSELVTTSRDFESKSKEILLEKKRKTTQFISEGITFLALIILGAVFMYRAVRRQFTLQTQQENFMMAITHELKTPIAIAKLNLETLLKHHLDDSKREKLLHMTLEETNRLNNLASNILVSAQLESGRSFSKEELNLSDLVQNSVNDYMNRYPDRKWHVMIQGECEVTGDALLLQILVNNLLENAIKYSPAKSSISCSLTVENNHIALKITDEGPGIADAEKRKVFQKFYRIGSEQTRSAKGSGLGLYLCSKIAEDHHAQIRIENNHPKGSVFVVRFEKNIA